MFALLGCMCRTVCFVVLKATRVLVLQVERKLHHQAKAFKMRILTLEASIKDLKQTNETLQGQACAQEQELETRAEELNLSQARERLLARDIIQANEALAYKSRLVEDVGTQVELGRRELSLEQTARKVNPGMASQVVLVSCPGFGDSFHDG